MTFRSFLFSILILAQFWSPAHAQGQMHFTNYQSIYGDQSLSYLGWFVDMEDDQAVVSTERFLGDERFGGAYLFQRDSDDTWRKAARLRISTPLSTGGSEIEDVQIEGDVVMVVTDLSGVFFFERPSSGWRDMDETVAIPPTSGYTIEGAQFRNDHCLILERGFPTLVHLYKKTGSSWADRQLVKTFSLTERIGGGFRSSKSNIVLTSEFFAFPSPTVGRGKVHIYERSGSGNWPDAPSAILEPDTSMTEIDDFGQALATDGETLFIGSRENDPENIKASLFIAEKGAQGWQSAKLAPQITFDKEDSNPAYSFLLKGDSLFVGRQFGVTDDYPLAWLYSKPALGWGALTGSGIPLRLVNQRDQEVEFGMLGWSFDLENEYGIFGNWAGENPTPGQGEGGQGEVAFVKLATDCQPITEIAAPIVGIGETGLTTVELAWETAGYSFTTELAYREADSSDPYHTLLSTDHREILTNLQPSTTYEYKVRNVCGPFGLPDTTAYSELQQFTTGMGGVTELVKVPLRGLEDIDHNLISRLAMDDSTAAVGLSDFRILVLENQDSVWRRVATLAPSSPPPFSNLAMDNGTIVAANFPFNATPEDNNGQLYIWEKPETGWEDGEETAKVVIPANTRGQNVFGNSLEIMDQTVMVGGFRHGDNFGYLQGSVFVVEKTNEKWDENPPAELTANLNGRVADLRDNYSAFGLYAALTQDLITGASPTFTLRLSPQFDFRRNTLAFTKPASGWSSATESFELPTINPGYLTAEYPGFEAQAGSGNAIATQEIVNSHLFSFQDNSLFSITELSPSSQWDRAPRVKSIHLNPNNFNFGTYPALTEDRLLMANNYFVNLVRDPYKNHIALYHKTSDTWADAALAIETTLTTSDGLETGGFRDFSLDGPFSGFVLQTANSTEDRLQFFTENRYCVAPTNVQAVVSNNSASPVVTLSWESLPTSSSWEVAYRPAGSEEPFTIVSSMQKMLVIDENLLFGTTYEYNVLSLCQDYPDLPVSAPTSLQEFITPCLPPTDLLSTVEVEQDNSYEISLTWEDPHQIEGYEIVIAIDDSTILDLQSPEAGVVLNSDLALNQEYQVQVRSICGQSAQSFYSEYVQGTFQLGEFIPEALRLYPNPTTGRVTVEVPISQIELQMPYQVVDQLGKTVSDGVISRNNFEIDFTHLHPGVYALRLTKLAENNVLRVVKF